MTLRLVAVLCPDVVHGQFLQYNTDGTVSPAWPEERGDLVIECPDCHRVVGRRFNIVAAIRVLFYCKPCNKCYSHMPDGEGVDVAWQTAQ